MIPTFDIRRVAPLPDAMLGVMTGKDHVPVCLTAELPWRNNTPFISCIPPGLYEAIKIMSPSRGIEVFQLVEVPDRSSIQLHKANAGMRVINEKGDTELLGCIAPGTSYLRDGMLPPDHKLSGYNGVLGSGKAFAHFMDICENNDTILLRIVNCF